MARALNIILPAMELIGHVAEQKTVYPALSLKMVKEISLREIWFLVLFKRVLCDIIRREASQVVFT